VLAGGGCFGGQGVELSVVDAFPASAAVMVDTFTYHRFSLVAHDVSADPLRVRR